MRTIPAGYKTEDILIMMTIRKAVFSVVLSGIAMSFSAPAFALETGLKSKAQTDRSAPDYSLPGVQPAKPIASPAQPEPDNATTNTNPDGSFNIGNTRVKISGDITVDVGTAMARTDPINSALHSMFKIKAAETSQSLRLLSFPERFTFLLDRSTRSGFYWSHFSKTIALNLAMVLFSAWSV